MADMHFVITVDGDLALSHSIMSVDVTKQCSGALKIIARFLATEESLRFFSTLDIEKIMHITVDSVSFKDCSGVEQVTSIVDGAFVCNEATLSCMSLKPEDIASGKDVITMVFAQYGIQRKEKRLFHD